MMPAANPGAAAIGLVAAIVFGALLSEDGATITAATLAASAVLDARLAFVSAFAGLWVGDLGVYFLARGAGSTFLQHRWFAARLAKMTARASRSAAPDAPASGGQQMSLALSRFVPGTRLPAYVSAGLARMPFSAFAAITAFSAIAWLLIIFALIHFAPSQGAVAKQHLAYLGLFDLAVFAILAGWRQCNERVKKVARWTSICFARAARWEFWPAWLFYPPVAMICAWLGLQYRGFALPTIANVNQKNGGIVGESKIGILQTLMETSPEFTAESFLIQCGPAKQRLDVIEELLCRHDFGLPFVLKPDTGQRGAGFKIIRSFEEVEEYLAQVSAPIVLQKYAEGPEEAGVFYYRFPRQQKGHIFGITRKEFPFVVGDGASSLKQLIERDSRARLIAPVYLKRFEAIIDQIPARGEHVRLAEAGNHCQGCIFKDGADLYSEELRAAFDEISRQLPGFYIGRYDIRYASDAELRAGTGFQIIELNGAASEATNIYDPANSLLSAYKTLYQQWKLVYQIGAANRLRGHQPAQALAVFKDWLEFSHQAVKFPVAD